MDSKVRAYNPELKPTSFVNCDAAESHQLNDAER
jgi:hypothetical protein